MTLSIVPALKARVMAVEFIKNNPRLKALVDHPAGPFTSKEKKGVPAGQIWPFDGLVE